MEERCEGNLRLEVVSGELFVLLVHMLVHLLDSLAIRCDDEWRSVLVGLLFGMFFRKFQRMLLGGFCNLKKLQRFRLYC